MVTDELPDLNRNVQRLLGRCLLRLQNYERLLKGLLTHSYHSGTAEELEALRLNRADQFAKATLGSLVKSLFDEHIFVSGENESTFVESQLAPGTKVAFELRFRTEIPEERIAQLKESLKDLVLLRNELVHHLVERFDISAIEGCQAASRYLERSDAKIESHYRELQGWAMGLVAAQKSMQEFMQSGALRGIVVDGIHPDGSIQWEDCGIVRALRDATDHLSQAGWSPLHEVTAWIAQNCPDQVPKKYGCVSWAQVLNDSRLFRLEYRRDDAGRKSAWFALKPDTRQSHGHAESSDLKSESRPFAEGASK